jgi:hypothetical protein
MAQVIVNNVQKLTSSYSAIVHLILGFYLAVGKDDPPDTLEVIVLDIFVSEIKSSLLKFCFRLLFSSLL